MASTANPGNDANTWKRCSTCRGPIVFGRLYYVCSVSTCNRARTTYRFCSVECWEEHLPLMRHREAWAVEETAPTREAWAAEEAGAAAPAAAAPAAAAPAAAPGATPCAPERAPKAAPASPPADGGAPRRRIVGSAPKPAVAVPAGSDEVLVVASRFKAHVKERFGMNTSDAVLEVLSDHLRALCLRAAENARADGRKTVMDRDFEFLRRR